MSEIIAPRDTDARRVVPVDVFPERVADAVVAVRATRPATDERPPDPVVDARVATDGRDTPFVAARDDTDLSDGTTTERETFEMPRDDTARSRAFVPDVSFTFVIRAIEPVFWVAVGVFDF